ncbi:hypothetical protein NKI09_04865 [Mesorhizobium sp. M0757]|uniref:hypothetical protein n=1 Tax=Mesorhizobium sp. M0757 TaxID=2956993 RepID=UPI00333B6892
MSAVIAWFLSNQTILAIGAAIIGTLGFGFQQRLAGPKPSATSRRPTTQLWLTEFDKIDDCLRRPRAWPTGRGGQMLTKAIDLALLMAITGCAMGGSFCAVEHPIRLSA